MMLRFIREDAAAKSMDDAVLKVVEEGQTLTPDLGGNATTSDVGDAILAELKE